jgi:hypothetical protein
MKLTEEQRQYHKEYREKHKEKHSAYMKNYYMDNKEELSSFCRKWRENNNVRILFKLAMRRAKQKNIDFTIEESDIIVPEFCPLLGTQIKMGTKHDKGSSASLDRIDPSLGYVKGNVWVISNRANTAKSNLSFKEFETMYLNWKTLNKLEEL